MKTYSDACHLKGFSKWMYIRVFEEGSIEILNIGIYFYIKYYHAFGISDQIVFKFTGLPICSTQTQTTLRSVRGILK